MVIGGAQVLTRLAPWTQTLHLALGAIIWALMAGLVVTSYYTARVGAGATSGLEPGWPHRVGAAHPRRHVRAYIALTKPRIIELLLVTTVPAMVLATRQVPGIAWTDWAVLVVWTMVGGTLAAGSANAINCYLDRDIDALMTRTRRRPLPAHQVEPERAVVFGIVLGVISFAVMAWFVNLLAAFLTLLAIGFYVVVYTIMLKRSTPQNIVIGGAAGALPPVIGWVAVTGSIGLPALLLFALVFYWTPPHFWALSLRIRKDYAAAGVPMLPVVKGIPETTRQIALYTILMVAISLVLFAVARMGAVYLVAAVVLGAIFLWQAWGLWRRSASEEASTAGAIRLYKYSISYLSPAVPRGRDRRAGRHPGLVRALSRRGAGRRGPAGRSAGRRGRRRAARPGFATPRPEQPLETKAYQPASPRRPVAAELANRARSGGRHDRREHVVRHVARARSAARGRPPRPFGVRNHAEPVGDDLRPHVVGSPTRLAMEHELEERPADVEHDAP